MKFATSLRSLLTAAIFSLTIVSHAAIAERPLTAESLDTTLADAHRIAATNSNLQVLRIEGRSMLPFFGEGSVVIVKKIDAAGLRAGMVVVYKNRFGEMVAHRLVASTSAGWTAQGYNNTTADSTPVNQENLLGVVYVTLHSNGVAENPAAVAAMVSRTTTVFAAPAK